MIPGYVDKYLQAKIPIAVLGKNGNVSTLEAVVDTGFDKQKILVDVLVSKSRDTLIGAALLANKKLEIDYTNNSVRIRNSRRKKIKRS